MQQVFNVDIRVSTHSRAEAAAATHTAQKRHATGFNTQPRGGGCAIANAFLTLLFTVSTHSRAEAAART